VTLVFSFVAPTSSLPAQQAGSLRKFSWFSWSTSFFFEFLLSCHVKPCATHSGGKRFRRSLQILITLRQADGAIKGGEIGGFQVLALRESRQGCMKNHTDFGLMVADCGTFDVKIIVTIQRSFALNRKKNG
jgi:hypothetical protein